jgi:hypothetical protein
LSEEDDNDFDGLDVDYEQFDQSNDEEEDAG